MDHVLAKVKRLRKNPYKKLLSDTSLYPPVNLDAVSAVKYNPDHNLDEDSWFKVDSFSKSDFFLKEIAQPIDVKNYDDIKKSRFNEISFLLSLQGEDVYFQKVTPSSFLRRSTIAFGEVASLEKETNRIVVKSEADAIFFRKSDVLLFKDIASVSSIFKGIDQLYKEATDEEVKEFLDLDFIELTGPYDYNSVSKPNRKRLALVSETIENMTKLQRENLIEYIKEYCKDKVKLTADGKSFELSTDKQLKLILYGIEERFYTTEHSREKRLANSVEALD